jgi:DNA repair photolyase
VALIVSSVPTSPPLKGRGAGSNPTNRFLGIEIEIPDDPELRGPNRTVFYKDTTRSAITQNESPDVGFEASINPYRGCEHGCAYCYARPTHEYLGLSAGLDFETKIFVKQDIARLLRKELLSPRYEPKLISLSGVTDPYQPCEKHFKLTRQCLEVLNEFKNPVSIITKNHNVTRDIDLLSELAAVNAAVVLLSVTTLDAELCGQLEPRTSRPQARLEAISTLTRAGIPVGVMIAPCIPGLTDEEMPAILKAAREAGASFAGYVPVRLPGHVLTVFQEWLEAHAPLKRDKILNRIRSVRGGKLNDPNFNTRMRGEGPFAEQLRQMFHLYTRKQGYARDFPELSTAHFQRPGEQLGLAF